MHVSLLHEYWIKENALVINLNFFDDPDFMQASLLAEAVIMAFSEGIISYNAAHNFRTWPIDVKDTHFETSSALYVYARLDRSESNSRALIVYDPEYRDIEGRIITGNNKPAGEPTEEFFYILLGRISGSMDENGNKVPRTWIEPIRYGTLRTDLYTTEHLDSRYVHKEFFEKIFAFHEKDGSVIPVNDRDRKIDNIESVLGLWTDHYFSCKGLNPGTGGSGSGEGGASALYQLNDVARNEAGTGVLDAVEGSLLVYDGTHWKGISQSAISPDLSGYARTDWVTSQLSGYATTSWVSSQLSGYATAGSLNALSDRLNDFLTGSDTDNIINKWKELEAFLTGFTETDTLAGALGGKLDKDYFNDLFEKVNIGTDSAPVYAIHAKYGVYADWMSVKGINPGTGGSSGASSLYELADVQPNEDGTGVLGASAGKVLTYGSDGKWYAADAARGLDVSAMWDALSAADSSKKIDASHLPDLGGKYVTLDTFQTITSVKAFSNYVHFRTGARGLAIYSDLRGNAGAIEIMGENGLWAAHSLEFENSGNIFCYHRFTSKGGIYAYGRVFGSGDDEGIVVNRAENRYAALTLGDATGLHSTFYLFPDNRALWRYNDGTTAFDIEHPYKSGTVALVSDLSDYVRKSGDTMTGALNFANNTPNLFGDDVYIGDLNRGGHLGIKGANGETGISFLSKSSAWSSNVGHYSISWNGTNMRASSNALFNNLNADMLDGYHRENLFNNHIEVMNTWGKTVTINIEGDSNTYYPVVISCIHEKEWLHHISVWKNLGSRTASYPGNHSNGTSSLWVMYEGRNNEWDGNCGFYRTVYWNYGYAVLVAKAEATGGSDGRLIVWLRGGGTEYKISADYKVYVDIYYEEHDISRYSDYPKYVAPTTEIGNKGVVNTQPMFGSLRGSLWGQWYDAVDGVNGKLTVRHSGLYGLELRSTDSTESSIDYRALNGDRFVAGAYPHRFFIWKDGFGEIISFLNNGNVGIGNTNPYYTLDVNGSVMCTDWIRTRGNNGWYNESYDGGIWMEDSTYVKVYGKQWFRCDMFSAGINGHSDDNYSAAYNAAAPNNDNYCCYSFIRSGTKAFGMGFNTDNEIWLGTANMNRKASSQWIHINDRGVWTDGYLSCKGNNTSDARLKEDINDFNATSILRLLRPVSFKWNDIARRNSKVFDTDGVQYGLIAQETKAVAPWAVVDNMFNDGYMGVRYEKFIPLLMKAEIETMDEVTDLKRRLTDVERENEILKKKLKMLEAA